MANSNTITIPNTRTSFFRNTILVIFTHFLIYSALYCILFYLGYIKVVPSNDTLMRWDAEWYKRIINEGYWFIENKQSSVAFFPLFPLFWKVIKLSPILMSLLNLLFTISGLMLLREALQFSNKKLLFFLSIPCFFFYYVPYSEALFFLSGSLIIYGLKKDNWLAYLGIFLACLTRSASLTFIPIIIFSKMYNWQPNEKNKKLLIETLILVLTALTALFISQYVQYLGSGRFFTLFETQKAWDRVLCLPKFPLTTSGEGRLLWLDGSAFFIGLLAAIICIVLVIKKIRKWNKSVPSYYLFSLGYLCLVACVAVLLSNEKGSTSLWSLNRFVFASPYFLVFLSQNLKHNATKNSIFLFVVSFIICSFLMGVGGSIGQLEFFSLPWLNTKIYFALMFLYSFSYLFLVNRKMDILFYGIYLMNLLIQLYLFNNFMNSVWVG